MDNREKRHKLLAKVKQEIPTLNTDRVLMVNEREKKRKRLNATDKPEGYYDLTVCITFSAKLSFTMVKLMSQKNEGLCFPYGLEGNEYGGRCDLCITMNSDHIRSVRSLLNKVKISQAGDWDFWLLTVSLREDSNFLDD